MNQLVIIFMVAIIASLTAPAQSFSTGAPDTMVPTVCTVQEPMHTTPTFSPVSKQDSDSLPEDVVKIEKDDGQIKVTVKFEDVFKGLLLTLRDQDGKTVGNPVGDFPMDGFQTVCNGHGVTHNSATNKTMAMFTFNGVDSAVSVRVTLVKEVVYFWVFDREITMSTTAVPTESTTEATTPTTPEAATTTPPTTNVSTTTTKSASSTTPEATTTTATRSSSTTTTEPTTRMPTTTSAAPTTPESTTKMPTTTSAAPTTPESTTRMPTTTSSAPTTPESTTRMPTTTSAAPTTPESTTRMPTTTSTESTASTTTKAPTTESKATTTAETPKADTIPASITPKTTTEVPTTPVRTTATTRAPTTTTRAPTTPSTSVTTQVPTTAKKVTENVDVPETAAKESDSGNIVARPAKTGSGSDNGGPITLGDGFCIQSGNKLEVVPETDCKKFYTFIGRVKRETECAEGTKFSCERCTCDHEKSVVCKF